MESNTLPTADTFILHKIIINESFNYSDIVLWTKEYAVLFARHHRKDMIEAVNKSIYVSFDCDIVDQERIEKIIENAYPESNIV